MLPKAACILAARVQSGCRRFRETHVKIFACARTIGPNYEGFQTGVMGGLGIVSMFKLVGRTIGPAEGSLHFGGQSPVRLQAAGFAKRMLGSCHPIWKLGAPFQELRIVLDYRFQTSCCGRKKVRRTHACCS